MEDNKLIDLHKVAKLFREIQTEDFNKVEAKEQSEFKKTIEAIDSAVDEAVEEEVTEELTAAQKKLPAGLRDAIAKKKGDSADDEEVEEVEENINASTEEAKDWQMPKVDKNTPQQKKHKFPKETGWSSKEFAAINVNTGENGFADKDELDKFTHVIPTQEFTYFDDLNGEMNFADFDDEMADQEGWTKINKNESVTEYEEVDEEVSDTTLSDILKAAGVKVVTDADLNQAEAQPVEEEDTEEAMIQPEMEEACEECSETPCVCSVEEEAVSEEPEMVSIDANTLQQILNLAGVKPVTDADINQPEPVEEYSNSPDEEYADTDTQLNKMSGGPNRPKVMPAVGNDGHNKLVMKLKKAYSDIE